MQNKIHWSDLFLFLIIVVLIATMIYAISIYERDKFRCVSSPINYYEQINNVSCQCRKQTPYDFLPNVSLNPYP